MNFRGAIPNRRGAALLLTLWCVAVVAISVVLVARVVDADVTDESLRARRFEAREAALTGVAYGINPQVKRDSELLHQKFDGGRALDVRVASESGRLNINRLLKMPGDHTLKNLFTRWGIPEDEASAAVDSLADWVDADDLRRLNGAERDSLAGQTVYSLPQNREFHSISEMARVRGMDAVEQHRPDWREFFSVFSGEKLDIQDSPPELLEVAAGLTGEQALAIAAYRNGPDRLAGTADDILIKDLAEAVATAALSEAQAGTLAAAFQVGAEPTRVESTGWQGETKYEIAVVVNRAQGKGANLSWEEQ